MVRLKNIFDSRKLLKDFGASLQFEKGIEKTVMWYLFSKITPSLFVDKASCTRQFESKLSLHSLASLFPLKEGSTSHLGLLPSGKKSETAPPRRSEPLRYKVGGASKPSPCFAGWDRLTIATYGIVGLLLGTT